VTLVEPVPKRSTAGKMPALEHQRALQADLDAELFSRVRQLHLAINTWMTTCALRVSSMISRHDVREVPRRALISNLLVIRLRHPRRPRVRGPGEAVNTAAALEHR